MFLRNISYPRQGVNSLFLFLLNMTSKTLFLVVLIRLKTIIITNVSIPKIGSAE